MTRLARCGQRGAGLMVGVVLAALLSGCGGGLNPVEGKVVWKDGSPAKELQGSHVVFDLTEQQVSARGLVEADGSFRLTTNKPNDGAPAGEYKVLIIEVGRRSLGGPDATALAPGVIDSKYSDPRTSGLKASVKAGTNPITLTVERNPARR